MRLLRRRHRVSPLRALIGVVVVLVVGAQMLARDKHVRQVSQSVAQSHASGRWVSSPVLLDSVAQTDGGVVTIDEIWVERSMRAHYGVFARPDGRIYLVARVRAADTQSTLMLRAPAVPADTILLGRRIYALPNQRATYTRTAFPETLQIVQGRLR